MNFKRHHSTFDEKLSAIFGLIIGAVLITAGFWVRNTITYERATLTDTQGTVVDTISRRERSSKNNQEKETYAPIIEFLVNGDRTRFTGNYESYRVSQGNVVIVRYDPKKPATTARVIHPFEGVIPWIMFGMGGLATLNKLGALIPIRWSRGE